MKCANCSAEAVYSVKYPTAPEVVYCSRCIPAHLFEHPLVTLLTTDAAPARRKRAKQASDEDL